jgi:hypothetical protein
MVGGANFISALEDFWRMKIEFSLEKWLFFTTAGF